MDLSVIVPRGHLEGGPTLKTSLMNMIFYVEKDPDPTLLVKVS